MALSWSTVKRRAVAVGVVAVSWTMGAPAGPFTDRLYSSGRPLRRRDDVAVGRKLGLSAVIRERISPTSRLPNFSY